MDKHNNNIQAEEVDLGYLFSKIGDFFKGIVKAIYAVIAFFIRFWIVTVVLLLVGFGLGYYLDSVQTEVYDNTVIVIPNFESVDYLYESVDEINSKIAFNDTIFLKEALGPEYQYLKKIKIEAIPDIYNFVAQSREHIDVFRILFENQELEEFIEDMPTSKNYKYHKINFRIAGKDSQELIEKFLSNINSNEHFLAYKEAYVENNQLQLDETTKMLTQIDSAVMHATSIQRGSDIDQYISMGDNRLDLLLFRKQEIMDNRLKLQKKKRDQTATVKVVGTNYNVIDPEVFRLGNMIKVPLLFIVLFGLIFLVRHLFRGMKSIAEAK
jgi:hypothetical protein